MANKDVKVNIQIKAKDLASNEIMESVKAVKALSSVTGMSEKNILKLNGGLVSMLSALKILSDVNKTVGISSRQIQSFSEQSGLSLKIINDFMQAYKSTAVTIKSLNNRLSEAGAKLQGLEESGKGSSEEADELRNKISSLKNEIEDLNDQLGTSDTVVDDYVENLHSGSVGLDENSSSLTGLIDKHKIANVAIEVGKKLYEAYSDTLQKVGEVALDAGESIISGIGSTFDVIGELISITDDACSKFKELADAGSDIQQDWFKLYNYLGENSGTEYVNYLSELQDVLSIDPDHIVGTSEGLLSTVSNLGIAAGEVDDAMKSFTNMSLDLSAFVGSDVDAVMTQLESAINLGVLRKNSPLSYSMNLTGEDVEAFRELNTVQERANFILSRGEDFRGNYEKWLQTAGGKVVQLNNSIGALQGTLNRLATGLYAKFAPVITAIIKLLDKLASSLARLLGIDLTDATNNMANGFNGIASGSEIATEAIDKTTESAKKLDRQVASFDDVIQLNDNKSSGTDLADINESQLPTGGIDFGNWLYDFEREKTDFEKKLEELYNLITDNKWSEAGNYIKDKVVGWLDNIDWNDIKDKVGTFTSGFSNLLAGLLKDGDIGLSVGTTVSEILNTVVNGLNNIFNNKAIFDGLGKTFAEFFNGLFTNIDTVGIANLLANVVKDIFITFGSFVDTMNANNTWQTIGFKISDIINRIFSDFTLEDIESAANDIVSFIDGVFEMLGTFIDNLNTEEIKSKVTLFVRTLFEGFKEHQEEWAETLQEFISFIIEMIEALIHEWDSSDMRNEIVKFISDSGIGDLVMEILKLQLKVKWDVFVIEALAAIESFFGFILEKIGNLIGYILLTLFGLVAAAAGIGTQIGEVIASIGQYLNGVFLDLGAKLYDVIQQIKSWFIDLGDSIKGIFQSIGDFFVSVWDSIMSGISTAISAIAGWFTSISDGLSGIISKIGDILGFSSNQEITYNADFGLDLPQFAKGGIVKRATIAEIGEAGQEAVIPLDNNTEWMDTMANSLVTAMGNKNTGEAGIGGQVVIDMSKCSKLVYTRSEMQAFGRVVADALNTYGWNVSLN